MTMSETTGNVIIDGIVDPEKWGQHGYPKIVFFLKEAYSDKQDFNLCEFLNTKECMKKTMWYTAAAWADLILNPFDSDNKDVDTLHKILQHCAVVNVKKENGNKTSDPKDLDNHFYKNRDRLLKEIQKLEPKIIITGGTFKYLEAMFDKNYTISGQLFPDHVGFYQVPELNCSVIRLRHPSYSEATTLHYFHILQKRYRERYEEIRNW